MPLRRPDALLAEIRAIHESMRDEILEACLRRTPEDLGAVVAEEGGDAVYAIDRVSEAVLIERFGVLAREWPLLLVAEGLGADGRLTLPRGISEGDVEIVVIVDPIDGTRGLTVQKRPAWILTGVAPYLGRPGTVADIELAVQTEIPLVKQHLSDALWAIRGRGAAGERFDRTTGARVPLAPRPSRATTIRGGFGGLVRFFPGSRAESASIDDEVATRVLGAPRPGEAITFEDQYISTGGQLYELIVGHDRWLADLRPLLGAHGALCCHPYDICTELVAREAGVIVTDARGRPVAAPLDVFAPVAWIGYANAHIQAEVAPALAGVLHERLGRDDS